MSQIRLLTWKTVQYISFSVAPKFTCIYILLYAFCCNAERQINGCAGNGSGSCSRDFQQDTRRYWLLLCFYPEPPVCYCKVFIKCALNTHFCSRTREYNMLKIKQHGLHVSAQNKRETLILNTLTHTRATSWEWTKKHLNSNE